MERLRKVELQVSGLEESLSLFVYTLRKTEIHNYPPGGAVCWSNYFRTNYIPLKGKHPFKIKQGLNQNYVKHFQGFACFDVKNQSAMSVWHKSIHMKSIL